MLCQCFLRVYYVFPFSLVLNLFRPLLLVHRVITAMQSVSFPVVAFVVHTPITRLPKSSKPIFVFMRRLKVRDVIPKRPRCGKAAGVNYLSSQQTIHDDHDGLLGSLVLPSTSSPYPLVSSRLLVLDTPRLLRPEN